MSPVVSHSMAGPLSRNNKQPKAKKIKSLLDACLSPRINDGDCGSHDQTHQPNRHVTVPTPNKQLLLHSPKTVTVSNLRRAPNHISSQLNKQHNSGRSNGTAIGVLDSTSPDSVVCSVEATAKSDQPSQLLDASGYQAPATIPLKPSSCQQSLVLTATVEDPADNQCSSSDSLASPAAALTTASAITGDQPWQASAGLITLSDEQLQLLSSMHVSYDAVKQCSLLQLEQLVTCAAQAQELGRSEHSLVVGATIPWSVVPAAAVAEVTSAAQAAGISTAGLAAAAAGLPVVIKFVTYERIHGSGLFNMGGRLREERYSRLAGASPYFPVLYRAVHMKRRSYFIFSSVTAHPLNLAEFVQQRAAEARSIRSPSCSQKQQPQQQPQQQLLPDSSRYLTASDYVSAAQPGVATAAAAGAQQQQQEQHSPSSVSWHESVLQILHDVGKGLDHLHSLGLLHLDVKPGNIIMRKGGHTYLIDLGVACVIDTTLEQHGLVGTEAFMDPQIRHDTELLGSYHKHHDYYSLGAVALYLVTKGRCNLFLKVQTELDKAVLLEAGTGKALGGLSTNCGLNHHSVLGSWRNKKCPAATAAEHTAKARWWLSDQTGVGRGMVDLITTLMGPVDGRPKSFKDFTALLQNARLCNDPEQMSVAALEDSRKMGVVLYLVVLVAAVICVLSVLWAAC